MTENIDGEFHLLPHSDFDGEVTQSDTKTLFSYFSLENQVGQPDFSGEWTGKSIGWLGASTVHGFVRKGYFKTGSTAATAPIRLKTYEGTDENGKLVFDQSYPASQFPASSTVEVIENGFTELTPGLDLYMEISSDEDFSLLTDAAVVNPWAGYDVSLLRYDNFLQTAEWIDGATYNKNQWFIYNRKIYECSVTGVQTGTFLDNSDKWHAIGEHSEKVQTTGILSGGVLSRPTASTLSWTSGNGIVTDYTDPNNPDIIEVEWGAVASYSPTNIGTNGQYLIAYDKDGNVSEIVVTELNAQAVREYIVIGGFSVISGMIPRISDSSITLGYNGFFSFKDFIRDVIGPANIEDNIISPNAGSNLSPAQISPGDRIIINGIGKDKLLLGLDLINYGDCLWADLLFRQLNEGVAKL